MRKKRITSKKTAKKIVGKKGFFSIFKNKSFNLNIPILKEEKALLVVSVLIFFLVFIIFLEMRRPQIVVVVFKSQETAEKNGKTKAGEEKEETPKVEAVTYKGPVNWQSFGDNFSSDAYLDKEKTTMHLDDIVTSLTFPPLYNFEVSECEEIGCDLLNKDDVFYLQDSDVSYLEDLKNTPRPLPSAVRGGTVVAAKISRLETKEVALFVVKNGPEEQVLAYFINGNSYEPIITNATEAKIITKYGKGGGIAVAGGDDDDFLIVYTGYESQALHYKAGKLTDISRFFGLRVANEGFYPHVIKQGEGSESTWYVISASRADVKLIKLWQNSTNRIQGAYDISHKLSGSIPSDSNLLAIKENSDKGKLEFLLGLGLNRTRLNNHQLLTFFDNGFDNKEIKYAVSKNINNKNHTIYKAMIENIGLAWQDQTSDKYIKTFPVSNIELYLGDSLNNLQKVNPKREIAFTGETQELYWQINFHPTNNPEHSPWLDHLNDLRYLVSF